MYFGGCFAYCCFAFAPGYSLCAYAIPLERCPLFSVVVVVLVACVILLLIISGWYECCSTKILAWKIICLPSCWCAFVTFSVKVTQKVLHDVQPLELVLKMVIYIVS